MSLLFLLDCNLDYEGKLLIHSASQFFVSENLKSAIKNLKKASLQILK